MATRQTGGRSRAVLFLVLSGLAALLAVGVLYRVIHGYQDELTEATRPPDTVKVVVAAQSMHQGVTITEEMLKTVDIEPSYVPDGVFHDINELVGRVPAERIVEGEYVRQERLADANAGIGLNAIIPRGQRAISIAITDAQGVSGFLNPGNYVDILLTLQSEKLDEKRTITLLQAVKVLAVNSRLSSDADDGPGADGNAHNPSVMIAVTPENAEKITHATNAGVITLTLRNDVDVTQQTTQGAHSERLLGKKEEQVKFTNIVSKVRKPLVVKAPDHQIEIFHGTQGTTQTIKPQ